jgi:hypothetical protein
MHLNSAHIILLLVSRNFMASDYCYGIEMKRAMEKHEAGTGAMPLKDLEEKKTLNRQMKERGNLAITASQ